MITLKESIKIKTTHKKFFEWFAHFAENYCSWHPDHVDCRWLKGKPFEEGSILYASEYLHGKLHKLRFKITKVEENKRIEFKNLFPESIISPKGSFIIEPKGESCIFTSTLSFRFGWLLSKFAKNEAEGIKMHMKEEGENLKRLLENEKD